MRKSTVQLLSHDKGVADSDERWDFLLHLPPMEPAFGGMQAEKSERLTQREQENDQPQKILGKRGAAKSDALAVFSHQVIQ